MEKREPNFCFFFKYDKRQKDQQRCDVFIWDVCPSTFKRYGGGRWGYFIPRWKKKTLRSGLFGELHLVRRQIRFDTIVHEVEHLRVELMWANGETITRRNEERMNELLDMLSRRFRKGLKKVEPKIFL